MNENNAKIKPLAEKLGVAVEKLWKIYVREYLVVGLTQVASAIFFGLVAWVIYNRMPIHDAFAFIPVVISFLFVYSAIQYLGNPEYHALDDITTRIKNVTD